MTTLNEDTQLLPVIYEQTKKAMDFDPHGIFPAFEEPGPWDLIEDHPETVKERITVLAETLGWTKERLEQEWSWMAWHTEEERSKDGDKQAQQEAPAQGHTEPEAGSPAAESSSWDPGEAS